MSGEELDRVVKTTMEGLQQAEIAMLEEKASRGDYIIVSGKRGGVMKLSAAEAYKNAYPKEYKRFVAKRKKVLEQMAKL